jgi:hypothetical protein
VRHHHCTTDRISRHFLYTFVLGVQGSIPGTNIKVLQPRYPLDCYRVGDCLGSGSSHSCLRRLVEFQVTISMSELVMKFGTFEHGQGSASAIRGKHRALTTRVARTTRCQRTAAYPRDRQPYHHRARKRVRLLDSFVRSKYTPLPKNA